MQDNAEAVIDRARALLDSDSRQQHKRTVDRERALLDGDSSQQHRGPGKSPADQQTPRALTFSTPSQAPNSREGKGEGSRRGRLGRESGTPEERASVIMEDGSELVVDPQTGRVLVDGENSALELL